MSKMAELDIVLTEANELMFSIRNQQQALNLACERLRVVLTDNEREVLLSALDMIWGL